MTSTPSRDPVTSKRRSQIQGRYETHVNIHQLNALAVRGLVRMFDAEKQLFCFRLMRTEHGLVREGISPRYTMISLLGLQQLENTGLRSPIEVKSALDTLLKNSNWINTIGDLGLLLWLCAVTSPERLEEIYFGFDVNCALNRYYDARERRTMELAWFLSGLAHGTLARREEHSDLKDLAVKTYRLLKNNQGENGIFGHLTKNRVLAGVLRGRIGSFADQVYPIYALTRFAQAYNTEEALTRAQDCAEVLCRAQGPLGQWWWHYDSSTGRVLGRYPVYAVHQDGMAPMALFALGEAVRFDYGEYIYRGLQWIGGKNELDLDLRDTSGNAIWRSICQKRYKKYYHDALSFLGRSTAMEAHDDLSVKFECRPYHLGWLLYAFASQDHQERHQAGVLT